MASDSAGQAESLETSSNSGVETSSSAQHNTEDRMDIDSNLEPATRSESFEQNHVNPEPGEQVQPRLTQVPDSTVPTFQLAPALPPRPRRLPACAEHWVQRVPSWSKHYVGEVQHPVVREVTPSNDNRSVGVPAKPGMAVVLHEPVFSSPAPVPLIAGMGNSGANSKTNNTNNTPSPLTSEQHAEWHSSIRTELQRALLEIDRLVKKHSEFQNEARNAHTLITELRATNRDLTLANAEMRKLNTHGAIDRIQEIALQPQISSLETKVKILQAEIVAIRTKGTYSAQVRTVDELKERMESALLRARKSAAEASEERDQFMRRLGKYQGLQVRLQDTGERMQGERDIFMKELDMLEAQNVWLRGQLALEQAKNRDLEHATGR
ncbi:hypothetical protein BDW74DRAFT_175224 [Aspergillus multicolor]|uniref:uncharacterized protein n=1 Tax=Aspergillus multicolor TaxID=41759 RepID=UPI003CCDD394